MAFVKKFRIITIFCDTDGECKTNVYLLLLLLVMHIFALGPIKCLIPLLQKVVYTCFISLYIAPLMFVSQEISSSDSTSLKCYDANHDRS